MMKEGIIKPRLFGKWKILAAIVLILTVCLVYTCLRTNDTKLNQFENLSRIKKIGKITKRTNVSNQYGKNQNKIKPLWTAQQNISSKSGEFLKNYVISDIITAARTISTEAWPVLVTIINDAYLPFAKSWLCNTAKMDVHKHVLLITTDNRTKMYVESTWKGLKVFSLDIGNELVGNQEFSHVGYVMLMTLRTSIILSVLRAKIPVLLFEVDCTWMANPLNDLARSISSNEMIVTESSETSKIAGGFILMRPTKNVISLWTDLANKMMDLYKAIKVLPKDSSVSHSENDQAYLDKLLKKGSYSVKYVILSKKFFPDGKWYKKKRRRKVKTVPYIINNNWITGNSKKIKRAKKYGHWFVTSEGDCDYEQVEKITEKWR